MMQQYLEMRLTGPVDFGEDDPWIMEHPGLSSGKSADPGGMAGELVANKLDPGGECTDLAAAAAADFFFLAAGIEAGSLL